MSLDGYLDDATATRLVLSNDEDLNRVRQLRGHYDAILVGAETVRRDNPSLRAVDGPQPRKVTLTATGDLDPASRFFTTGAAPLVLCPPPVAEELRRRLGERAEVQSLPAGAGLAEILQTLWNLGVRRLMVEGGGSVHTQFLTQGLADELRLAVAPFFVGDAAAPRFTEPGKFPHDGQHRMRLYEVEHLGDMAVLHYSLDAHG
ncbi:RibD family protein [Stackebrandtia nassauensis]